MYVVEHAFAQTTACVYTRILLRLSSPSNDWMDLCMCVCDWSRPTVHTYMLVSRALCKTTTHARALDMMICTWHNDSMIDLCPFLDFLLAYIRNTGVLSKRSMQECTYACIWHSNSIWDTQTTCLHAYIHAHIRALSKSSTRDWTHACSRSCRTRLAWRTGHLSHPLWKSNKACCWSFLDA